MSYESKKLDPAFPTETYNPANGTLNGHYKGVTVLDAFAMNAIQGLYAADPERASKDSPGYWAEWAYDIAEAMYVEKIKRESLASTPNVAEKP